MGFLSSLLVIGTGDSAEASVTLKSLIPPITYRTTSTVDSDTVTHEESDMDSKTKVRYVLVHVLSHIAPYLTHPILEPRAPCSRWCTRGTKIT